MSPRTLAVLVLLLALTAGWWGLARRAASPAHESAAAAGEPLAPGLERATELTRIRLTRGDAAAELTFKEGFWRADASGGGFPLDPEKVTGLLRTAARFTTDQPRTASPARHGALGLAWPDPDGAARRLTVYAGDDTAADLILGNDQWSPQPGVYARHAGTDATYLCRGRPAFTTDLTSWIPSVAAQVNEDEIAWVAYDGLRLQRSTPAPADNPAPPDPAEAEAEDGANTEPPAEPQPVWAAAVTDPQHEARWTEDQRREAVDTLPRWMDSLTLSAVTTWDAEPADGQVTARLTYGLKAGGELSVTVYRDDQDRRWVRLLASEAEASNAGGDVNRAATAHARAGTHAIQVPSFRLSGLDTLTAKPEADTGDDAEAAAVNPESAVMPPSGP